MKRLFLLFVYLLVFIFPTPVKAYTLSTASNVDYGGGLLMDVFYPSEAGNYPLMIYIHGGSWEAGSKSSIPTKMKDMVANDGFVIVSIDYGLAPSYDYPSPIVHIRSAIDYLKANEATYNIDVNRIGFYGESVGGHLAVLYEQEFDFNNDIDIVISNSAPMDLYLWDADRDADPYTSGNATSIAFYTKINQWIGYDNIYLQMKASPTWSTKRLDPTTKFKFIHGNQDNVIPRYSQKREVENLRSMGYYVEYQEYTLSGHVGTTDNHFDTTTKPFIENNL